LSHRRIGLESGLGLDAIADELGAFVDVAALQGDAHALGEALMPLAERLLAIRPFVPNAALPRNWGRTLRRWVSGGTVTEIGPEGVRLVEEAFAYRLVWGLDAVRARRMASGWDPEPGAGVAAASLETGVPQTMMSMLIRSGLPSPGGDGRRAHGRRSVCRQRGDAGMVGRRACGRADGRRVADRGHRRALAALPRGGDWRERPALEP